MTAEAAPRNNMDYIILLITMTLAATGLVMVYSSSFIMSETRFGDPYYFFRPQVVYVIFGMTLMLITRHIPYQLFCRLSYLILLVTVTALILVLIPGVGHRVGGASRWLRFAGLSFQPSELAKLALVIYLAYSLAAKREKIRQFAYGLFPHLIVLAVLVPLVLSEPDLGSAVILCLIAVIMMFAAGVPFSYLFSLLMLAAPVVYLLIIRSPYRLSRVAAYLRPWDDPQGAGYHIIHSFLAFASGGLTGVGPGGSNQKLFYLPEPHTDFIFSVVGEELGFIGVALIALLFLVLVARGLMVAMNSYELEGTYMALGLTMIIGLQAFMNMAVVTGLLPTKGLILPFFSYGGSAMVINFICIGILLNISSQGKPTAAKARSKNA